jgi:circadian clock protein KaiB
LSRRSSGHRFAGREARSPRDNKSKGRMRPATRNRKRKAADSDFWNLRLYIAGETARSIAALRNLQAVCDAHLPGKYRVTVIDLLKSPHLAAGDQILAVPTLVRRLPPPLKKIVGDLSNAERVLVGLDLRPGKRAS